MKRFFYLKKYEVKLGDQIELNGISDVTVTQALVDANPDLFEVKDEEYARKHKEKTLDDYEDRLLYQVMYNHYYTLMKEKDPKLYWLKVLHLIADDLNKDCEEDGNWSIYYDFIGMRWDVHSTSNYRLDGNVEFNSINATKKAIEIMGDKLDYIYKSDEQ